MLKRLPPILVLAGLLLPLSGCAARKDIMLKKVADSMSEIECPRGPWGAPGPDDQINVDHVAVPKVAAPDPRIPLAGAEPWNLDLAGALSISLGNSEVVRVLPGATNSIAGSTTGGAPGFQSTSVSSGAGNPAQTAAPNPSSFLSTGTGGFGPNGQGGFGPNGANVVGGGGAAGGAVSSVGTAVSSSSFATIYDPAIAAAQVESALGAFDAALTTSMFWERLENPPGQMFNGFINTKPRLDTAYTRSSITKPLLSGAQAGVAFNNDYYFIPPDAGGQPAINPQYQSHIELAMVQPMLRGFGAGVNQAGILIAGVRANQSAWEFKRRMMEMVRSVETAYWQLYASQLTLKVIEETLPLYTEVVRIEESRVRAGAAIAADLAQAQSNLFQLQAQRLQTLSDVALKQALLRNLLGLPPTDGRQIVLTDRPVRAPLVIDWDETVSVALDRRPDVIRQRLAVHVSEMQVMLARNGLLPQLNGEALYRIDGLGSDVGQSLSLLSQSRYSDWRLGATFQYPLGNHVARGQMRSAQMQLLREQALLKQTSHIVAHQLGDIVRNLDWVYQQFQVSEQRQRANVDWRSGARARFLTPTGGVTLLQAFQVYLQSINESVLAAQTTANLVAQYNIALAQLEEARGTLLADHGIYIFDDPCTAVQRTIFRGKTTEERERFSPPEIVPPVPAAEAIPVPPPAAPAADPPPEKGLPENTQLPAAPAVQPAAAQKSTATATLAWPQPERGPQGVAVQFVTPQSDSARTGTPEGTGFVPPGTAPASPNQDRLAASKLEPARIDAREAPQRPVALEPASAAAQSTFVAPTSAARPSVQQAGWQSPVGIPAVQRDLHPVTNSKVPPPDADNVLTLKTATTRHTQKLRLLVPLRIEEPAKAGSSLRAAN